MRKSAPSGKAVVPDKTIDYPRPKHCPTCNWTSIYVHQNYSKTVLDLKFMRHGIKRWIARYRFHRYKCSRCGVVFTPQQDWWGRSKFGMDIQAYALYQNIELWLSLESVIGNINRLFDLQLPRATASIFKQAAAKKYEETYNAMIAQLCSGGLLHADETTVSIKGQTAYVWVLANMEKVAYIYSDSRESDFFMLFYRTSQASWYPIFMPVMTGFPAANRSV